MSVCGRDHELKSLVVVEADCNVTPAPQLQVRTHAQRHPQCADCIFSVQLPQSELDAIAGEGDMAEVSEEDLAERKRRLATAREVPPVLHVLRLLSLTENVSAGVRQHAAREQRVGQLHHTSGL